MTWQQRSMVASMIGIGTGTIAVALVKDHFLPLLAFVVFMAFFIGFCSDKARAGWSGALFGFFTMLSFLAYAYNFGASDKIPGFVPVSLLLIVIGTAGSAIIAMVANKVQSRFFPVRSIYEQYIQKHYHPKPSPARMDR